MAGDNSYKPREIVKVSGIYSVVHDDGKGTFEVTCVEGEHFPSPAQLSTIYSLSSVVRSWPRLCGNSTFAADGKIASQVDRV
ncbi:hypothetical protein [Caballeronia sordidicola]|uniref:hypothetical protein n=1 Tax=Caballeronia sordidicola TaxID=196367 RepID=UPI00094D909F|nr:hypothetical protein [Caballeronia sordidicola]